MREFEYLVPGGELKCREHPGYIEITGFSGLGAQIAVPEQVNGLPIREIGKKAFLSRKTLRSITLPATVESVGDWAFAYCDGLREISFGSSAVGFGRAAFLDCKALENIDCPGFAPGIGMLMATAVSGQDGYYLLDFREAGSSAWLEKWDARMLTILRRDDMDGYSRQVLCGEEDYGSTDLSAFVNASQQGKVRILLRRFLSTVPMEEAVQKETRDYLVSHTKGCESEAAWQVILREHGEDRAYYELFASLGCVTAENLGALLADIGESYPEMKGYFLTLGTESSRGADFFDDLEL